MTAFGQSVRRIWLTGRLVPEPAGAALRVGVPVDLVALGADGLAGGGDELARAAGEPAGPASAPDRSIGAGQPVRIMGMKSAAISGLVRMDVLPP